MRFRLNCWPVHVTRLQNRQQGVHFRVNCWRHGVWPLSGRQQGALFSENADQEGSTTPELLLCVDRKSLPPDFYQTGKEKIDFYSQFLYNYEDLFFYKNFCIAFTQNADFNY